MRERDLERERERERVRESERDTEREREKEMRDISNKKFRTRLLTVRRQIIRAF